MSDEKQTINDVLEIVHFIKDNSATKQDLVEFRDELKGDIDNVRTELKGDIDNVRTELKGDVDNVRTELKGDIYNVRTELKGDIQDVKTEVITHVDGLAVLHQRLDTELAALRAKYERLESHVALLAKRANVQLDF